MIKRKITGWNKNSRDKIAIILREYFNLRT